MWHTQRPAADWSEEHLGVSDKGIILYRKPLRENIEKVRRGEDPMNVFCDPAKNVSLDLPVETAKFGKGVYKPGERRGGGVSKYSPLLREAEARTAIRVPAAPPRARWLLDHRVIVV